MTRRAVDGGCTGLVVFVMIMVVNDERLFRLVSEIFYILLVAFETRFVLHIKDNMRGLVGSACDKPQRILRR